MATNISSKFENDLEKDMQNEDIRRLQQLLNTDPETQVAKTGLGSPGNETDYYGPATENAVMRFQMKHGVIKTPQDVGCGRVGPQTRKMLMEVFRNELKDERKNTSLPFVWPLISSYKRITQAYGVPWSVNPKKQHTGLDIVVPAKEKVFAVCDGKIVKIGDLGGNWAQYIDIEHEPGLCTSYLHVVPQMAVNSLVKAGDLIATIADLGTNSHLHFNTWKGSYNNPLTHRGALPNTENVGKIDPKTDPVFPSNFVDPISFNYS